MLFNVINRWLSKIESRNAHARTHTHSDARRYKHHAGIETHTEISQTPQGSHEVTTDRNRPSANVPKKKNHCARTRSWSFSDAYNPLKTSGVSYRHPPSLNPSYVLSVGLRENPSANQPPRIQHSTGQLLVCALVIHFKSTCIVSTVKVLLKVILFVFVAENFNLCQSGAYSICFLYY